MQGAIMVRRFRSRLRLGTRLACSAALLVAGVGCNLIETAIGGDVAITEMVPGQSIGGDSLDCWLTLDFKRLPAGINPTDVRVRFESVALTRPTEFDWNYIAMRDVIPAGTTFGSGYRDLTESKPDKPRRSERRSR